MLLAQHSEQTKFVWVTPPVFCKHKMNLHSVLFNDSFALDFICATPLEQFQILPLSAQVYPASASISSLEQCNLFPQVSTDSEFVYLSGAGLAAKVTSWSHHAWLDLYSAVPSYIYPTIAASTNNAAHWGALEAGIATPAASSLQWYNFGAFVFLPVYYLLLTAASGSLWAYSYAISTVGVLVSYFNTLVCFPFSAVGMGLNYLPWQGGGGLTVAWASQATDLGSGSVVILDSAINASSMSYGVNLFFVQFSTFIQGLFAGQLLVGGLFTNFMLITVLGFIALKLFISLSLYETPLVPTRLQSIYEFFYGFILQTVCDQTGSKVGEKFMPAYLTLFFTVLSANVIALFPYTYSITSQLIVTFTISFFAFAAINVVGFLHHGVYLFGMLLPKGCPLAIVPAIVIIETVSYVFRVVSLALRIFANILSGHCMLKIVTIFVWFVFALGGVGFFVHGFSLAVVVMINVLEVAVAGIQAYVFTILCSVYTNDVLHAGH